MTFDLSDFSITTIGYSEPTLWTAVALASILALVVGRVLGSAIGHVSDRGRRLLYGISGGGTAALLFLALTVLLLDTLFSYYHRGMVCTVFVTPVLFIPAIIAVASERMAWKRARNTKAA